MSIFKNYFAKDSPGLLSSSFLGDAETPTFSLLSEGLDDSQSANPQLGISDNTPISDVAPAENSAQMWERRASQPQQFGIGTFGFSKSPLEWGTVDQNSSPIGHNTPLDQMGHLQDAPTQTSFGQKPDGPISDSFAWRSYFKQTLGMSGNDYLKTFGRINAHATTAKQDQTNAFAF